MMENVAFRIVRVSSEVLAAVLVGVGALVAQGVTFTLKPSVSGTDFDWSNGASYVGDPATGPAAGDTIVIPNGVTAKASAAARTTSGICGICNIHVEEGGVFEVYTAAAARTQTSVRTVTGLGTLMQPDAANAFDLNILEPCTFDGKIVGKLNYRVNKEFTLTDADQGQCTGSPIILSKARLRLARFSANGNKILGTGSFNMYTQSVIEYVGGPDISGEVCEAAIWSGLNMVFDAGAYGDFTYGGKFGADSVPWNIVLTGSNTVAAVYSGYRDVTVGKAAPVAFAKEGVGTWHMARNASAKVGGVFEVREGVLSFDTLAPIGENCSLGLANELYRFGATAVTEENRANYAILLGGNGTAGFLQCAPGNVGLVSNHDRQISLHGAGGFLSGGGRAHYVGVTADSAGEKTLILDGTENRYDTVTALTNGPGVVSVEKRGIGSWSLCAPFDFTGRLTVKQGRLDIWNGSGEKYEWYRIRFKCNAYQDPLFREQALASYRENLKKDASASEQRNVTVGEFMFYDAAGNRQCIFPLEHGLKGVTAENEYTVFAQATNASAVLCRPGEFGMVNPAHNAWFTKYRPPAGLFEGGANASGAYDLPFHYSDWFSQSPDVALDPNDPSTWVGVILHVTNGTPPLVACDFINQYNLVDGYCGRNVTMFDVSASADGLAWDVLLDHRFTELHANGSVCDSGATASMRSIGAARLAKCFQFTRTTPEQAAAPLAIPAEVSVAPGAQLVCHGAVTISRLALTAEGLGEICGENVSLASTGTIDVPPLPAGAVLQTFSTGLNELVGAPNLANWTLTIGGIAKQAYRFTCNPETGVVMVMRRGLVISVK
ncbi:MAG: hypothetical protein MJ240_10105 [Kiritimatiellae bacterium]|nr:hypothetical protein [Kiritimatiellia bacterium]